MLLLSVGSRAGSLIFARREEPYINTNEYLVLLLPITNSEIPIQSDRSTMHSLISDPNTLWRHEHGRSLHPTIGTRRACARFYS